MAPCAIDSVAFLGNHTPRQCGIATFTADLASAVQALSASRQCSVVAMNDTGNHYAYPERVAHQILEENLASYRRAAEYLNQQDFRVLSLQHEYGIFGGASGVHVLTLLRDVSLPIVTTLHTIVAEPSASQRAVMDELCELSERLVVMSKRGAELLSRVHGVPASKIDLIPHGIPTLPDASASKAELGLTGKRVLLTFGLLSPDKGIEYVIDSLVEIVKEHPDVLYIVLGATHPHVKARQGEAYREMLTLRSQRLGLSENVVFRDCFVSHDELVQYLAAADIYVTPYLNAEQITSGTLAYAVGCGKAVVSSPYRYAEELLAEERGVLVPAKDPAALARAINGLLGDAQRKADMEQRAATLGEGMRWPVVGAAYLDSFARAATNYEGRSRTRISDNAPAPTRAALPATNLSHLAALTDDTGLLQHACYAVPRYDEGYCVDDNARALLTLTHIAASRTDGPPFVRRLGMRYLAFVRHALDVETGRFRNFMTYERTWTERFGSEDSHARCLWALGTVIARTPGLGERALAAELFDAALPVVSEFSSPRAWAYTILGIVERANSKRPHVGSEELGAVLALRLLDLYQRSHHGDWLWFEDSVTYCNARMPQALIVAGKWLGHEEMLATGLRSLEWLADAQTTEDGLFAPVGSNGFHVRGGTKAVFDQQPVEACGMVAACLEAYRATGDRQWLRRGRQAFAWFMGKNQLDQPLYDLSTGGCRDGLHEDRPNENQGAESTLSFIMALLDMKHAERSNGLAVPRLTLVSARAAAEVRV
ncbi:MAG: glycosyltransferase family 4 protein [Sandaracinaceae bacterium]|nr:glycosyltransferase family 4 protein [Sandaracinaceae bacterium]